jgi:UDP-glucose 4-epimerase
VNTADFSGRPVLLTGGSGFIGSRLRARLNALGANVHATTRGSGAPPGSDAHWLHADLSDLEDVREVMAVARPDVVFHLASHVTGSRGLEAVEPTLRGNLISTVNVLTAAQERRCRRVVLAGSMEEPKPESDAVPSSPYAVAKWAASGYGRMFHALYALPVVLLRIFMVYGPGQRDRTKLVPYVIESLLRGESPRLTSGTRAVDWIYVDDVIDAFVAAARAEHVEGETLDVGSGTTVTIRTLVEMIAAIVPGADPVFGAVQDRPLETVSVASIGRTEEILGWRPSTRLPEGLRKTIRWVAQEADLAI